MPKDRAMKKLLLLLLFTITSAVAQDRTKIKGQVLVPDGNSREGLTVYNTSSNQGTITDVEGFFTLAVGENDRVVFSALQYNDVIVIIDKGIVDNEQLRLELVENLTVLDNVTVRPYDLSGNITVDVGNVRTTTIKPFEQISIAEIEFNNEIVADAQTGVTNEALGGFNFQNGLNFRNIFKAVFQKRDRYRVDEDAIEPNVDYEIRIMYEDVFFKKYLDLELEEIGPFIFYAEQEGLDATYLAKGKELDLLEFLIAKSKKFKETRN